MKINIPRAPGRVLLTILAGTVFYSAQLFAQSVTINAATEYQTVTGFGGMNGVGWIGDLTVAQTETAFGSGEGQLGLSIMRLRIDPNSNNWGIQVPSAIRARQLGAKLLATPWSPPAYMKTNNSLINGGKLKPEYYGDYATHLLNFADYMSRMGLRFTPSLSRTNRIGIPTMNPAIGRVMTL